MSKALPAGCPCCGYDTVLERCCYEICPICWWEDDGQDNQDADEVLGGPNSDLSLSKARKIFFLHGIFDPRRIDLTSQPTEGIKRFRTFTIDNDENLIESLN
jgi:hypothetical protein